MIEIRIQKDLLDPGRELDRLRRKFPDIGAIVSFIGVMRDLNEGELINRMSLEHYPGMTEKALHAIAEEAFRRWDLIACYLIHRVGKLHPTDPIVLVAVASTHRGEAFLACEFIIDYLKTRAPFWKKEYTSKGAHWVQARQTDSDAEDKWKE
jgi:molybdopterin synthase catalytic subunit